jgi:sulfite dehydrogenase
MKNGKDAPERANQDTSRRRFIRTSAALGGLAFMGYKGLANAAEGVIDLPFANGQRPLVAYPQKRPLMVMTERPVQLETPFQVFNQNIITPNDAFFVRWHLAGIPTTVNGDSFQIKVHGRVKNPLSLSVADLRTNFEPAEFIAVAQCSGNSRGFFAPRVPGGQWGNGAMGNAKWKGVRLRDILHQAGVHKNAVQVQFNGKDGPVLPSTPDFRKALNLDMVMDPSQDIIVAYEMNGASLPLLNGFPVRLVVPGYYATYWVKMLDDIEVINHVDQNFWMSKAYRIPDDPCGCMEPGQKGVEMTPINRFTVRSFITSLQDGAQVRGNAVHEVSGIAFDAGLGIKKVLFSEDGGRTWIDAELGKDYGKYSFRPWRARFSPAIGKTYDLACLAINSIGETQRFNPRWNPGGYLRNVVETVRIQAI